MALEKTNGADMVYPRRQPTMDIVFFPKAISFLRLSWRLS
jgi:hypothetical protein